jgi:transposase
MEIIAGVERRRRWRLEGKLRTVAEAGEPGARFAEVARRHEVSRSVLWTWRKQVRQGALAPEPVPMFVPVQVTADVPAPLGSVPAASSAPCGTHGAGCEAGGGRIEITLPDGTVIRVGEEIGSAALRRVVAALRG